MAEESLGDKIARLRALRLEHEKKSGKPGKKSVGRPKKSATKAKGTLADWYEQQKKSGRET